MALQRDSGAESGDLTDSFFPPCSFPSSPLPTPFFFLFSSSFTLCSSVYCQPVYSRCLSDPFREQCCSSLGCGDSAGAGWLPPPHGLFSRKPSDGRHSCQLDSRGFLRRKAGQLGSEETYVRKSGPWSPVPPGFPSPSPHHTRARQGSRQVTLILDARRKASSWPTLFHEHE